MTQASLRREKGLSAPISVSLKCLWRQKSSHLGPDTLFNCSMHGQAALCPTGLLGSTQLQYRFKFTSRLQQGIWVGCSLRAGCWSALEGPRLESGLSGAGWRVPSVGVTGSKCLVTWRLYEPCQLPGPSLELLGAGGESLPESWNMRCQVQFSLNSMQSYPSSSVSLTHVLAGVGQCRKEH